MIPVPDSAQERLDEVAELLAEGLLRARLRRKRRSNLRRRDREKDLAVSAESSVHASKPTFRNGEHA